MAAKFGLFVDEDHSKLPTLYWLPKLHKRPYKSRFTANSSACTTTELFIILTSCFTANPFQRPSVRFCFVLNISFLSTITWPFLLVIIVL